MRVRALIPLMGSIAMPFAPVLAQAQSARDTIDVLRTVTASLKKWDGDSVRARQCAEGQESVCQVWYVKERSRVATELAAVQGGIIAVDTLGDRLPACPSVRATSPDAGLRMQVELRFVTPDSAVASFSHRCTYIRNAREGVHTGGHRFVLRRERGVWKVVDAVAASSH